MVVRPSVLKNTIRFTILLGGLLFFSVPAVPASEEHLMVGIYDFDPLCRINDDKRPGGLFVDLLNEIAARERWRLNYVPGSSVQGFQRLRMGDIDLLVAAAYTKAQSEAYYYSRETVISTWAQVYGAGNSRIGSILDLENKSVAVVRDDPYNQELREIVGRFNIQCRFVEFKTSQNVFQAVSKRWVDAGVVDHIYGTRHEGEYNVNRTSIIFSPVELRFAAPRHHGEKVIDAIDYHLSGMKEDSGSIYYQIVNRVLGQEEGNGIPVWLKWGAGILACLLLWCAVMVLIMRRQIRIKTSELSRQNEALENEIAMRRRSDQALRESEERYKKLYEESKQAEEVYRSLIHSSADAIITYDVAGKSMYVSPSFMAMFGWDREDLTNNQKAFFPLGEHPKTMNHIHSLLAEGTPCRGLETNGKTKNGKIIDISISASRYDDHRGNTAGVLVIIRDITDTRRLQRQLQHAQKMETIGSIAAGVAHNFRNVLAGISLNHQLIQLKYKDDLRLQGITERVLKSVDTGAALVDDLMQSSRQEAQEEYRTLNLSEVLEETYHLIKESFDQRIRIEQDVQASLPIRGDHAGLNQVFMNLYTNARDAMPEGGVLQTEALRSGDRIRITVSDTGTGMDHATRDRCFDPFFTTKDGNEGTGLGLSTTYGIVKNHQGDIHVYSEPGQGTTFRIYFPIAEEVMLVTEKKEGRKIQGQGQSILVVDDEAEILEPLETLIKGLGYRADCVDNGMEAVTKYRASRPDAVILDRNMPGMDGVRCAEEIMECDPQAKIIILSGYDNKGQTELDEVLQSRIKGYLTKPIDIHELSEALGNLFIESTFSRQDANPQRKNFS